MPFHEFSNHSTTHFAAYIQDCINNYDEGNLFDYYFDQSSLDNAFIEQMLDPQRNSLIFSFSVFVINFDYEYYLKKYVGLGDWSSILEVFESYKVSIPNYDNELMETDREYFSEYIYDLRGEYVDKLANKIAKEVLEILFLNRILLKDFHVRVAEFLKTLDSDKYPKLFRANGNVHRTNYWPRWLHEALFYREQGRCTLCGEDLSKLVFTGAKPNIDHIVPLALGGTNDTTNLQLLCKSCNLRKLDHTIETRNRRSSFFY
jgi:DNA replicative helicase MCM subunit Mcm2 (Cdc46/Mcm family)